MSTTTAARDNSVAQQNETGQAALREMIEHAARFLPAQGPITVFVHHNTLHAFEDRQFDDGVQAGGLLLGCNPYLPEERYRQKLKRGRIRLDDLEAALLEDLGDESDRLVTNLGTRHALRLAMLQFPLYTGTRAELRWAVAEADALRNFCREVGPTTRRRMISQTRNWAVRNRNQPDHDDRSPESQNAFKRLTERFDLNSIEAWDDRTAETFVLNFLWRVCCDGIRHVTENHKHVAPADGGQRHRDLLLNATGKDTDLPVHDILIPFCAAFLDQGFAEWELLDRNEGFFVAFLNLYGKRFSAPTQWFRRLRHEIHKLRKTVTGPLASIAESLTLLGVHDDDRADFITQTLLALRGWAGMIWQMETNAEWTPHPAPAGSLVEFLAIRLILDRLAARELAAKAWNGKTPLDQLRDDLVEHSSRKPARQLDQRAFTVFQLAQVRGWCPEELLHLSPAQWQTLVEEIEAFSGPERRRIYHHAFERKYRNETLDAVIAHGNRVHSSDDETPPTFQLVCCIDDREESFRRHVEEVSPECETFGVAGFYGTAMYYRGATDAHFKPLCPVSIVPKHYVIEEPLYSLSEVERRRSGARKRLGYLTHRAHLGSRSFGGGMLTTLAGSLAAFPLVARILFPGAAANIRRTIGRIVEPPTTQLRIERLVAEPGLKDDQLGYSIEEMADIVEGVLRSMGLTTRWSRLVLFVGHGSTSLNNPHESAYNCGACSGSQGGPNARAFALMANDCRVRNTLAERGLEIPLTTFFVGGYHDTTNERVTFADLDRLPVSHRPDFGNALQVINEARARNAHERCRRFESAPITISVAAALRHVEDRPEDLSQARPEYNHATNALCLVGRRIRHRGLYLDRRAFLTSYDPAQDDQRGSILESILSAVIPVCAGINLEYYFSTVDVEGYGSGSKLPHNITSLLGVMAGAASDLRPGLSAQMTEIHEPLRILFVIETTPEVMLRIICANTAIRRLVNGQWVQLAIVQPDGNRLHRYVDGEFVSYAPQNKVLPIVESSIDWYGGKRDHLGFASIRDRPQTSPANSKGSQ